MCTQLKWLNNTTTRNISQNCFDPNNWFIHDFCDTQAFLPNKYISAQLLFMSCRILQTDNLLSFTGFCTKLPQHIVFGVEPKEYTLRKLYLVSMEKIANHESTSAFCFFSVGLLIPLILVFSRRLLWQNLYLCLAEGCSAFSFQYQKRRLFPCKNMLKKFIDSR